MVSLSVCHQLYFSTSLTDLKNRLRIALQALEKTLEETDPAPAAVPAVSMFSTAAVQH